MAADATLDYLDHNLGFDVEADASNHQLGVVIKQKGLLCTALGSSLPHRRTTCLLRRNS